MEVKTEPVVRVDCGQGLVKAVRFNADGQYALTCGSDRTIKLWRPSKLLQLKCYRGHSSDVLDCQANGDSSQFVSCSADRSVIAWDVETGKLQRRFRHLAPLNSVCYGTNASTVLASSADGSVRIYDLRALNALEPIQTLPEAADAVTSCRAEGPRIFSSSLDGRLRCYDLRRGSLDVDALGRPLGHLSLGPAGGETLLVRCLRGNSLLVERAAGGRVLNEFEGAANKLFRLESVFVLGDSCVAAGSEDGRAYVWGLAERRPRLALEHGQVAGPPLVQSVSSDSLDYLLTACGAHMFMWSL